MTKGHHARSAGSIAADFRDQLIIDRYDPVFQNTRGTKRKHLHGANGEDAVTWNVFRSLRQIDSAVWLPELFRAAFPTQTSPHCEHAAVDLWRTIGPPPGLVDGDDGESDIDVVIETPLWAWIIEGRLHGDMAGRTTTRADRDQVLRLIDVGSHCAGVRRFYFSLLVADRARSEAGVAAVAEFAPLARPRELLRAHRPDGLANLSGVSVLTWQDLQEVLADAAEAAARDEERAFAARAHGWLAERTLVGSAGR